MTRRLIHEDDTARVYEVTDERGAVVGRDVESLAPGPPTVEDLERSIREATTFDELRQKVSDGPTRTDAEPAPDRIR